MTTFTELSSEACTHINIQLILVKKYVNYTKTEISKSKERLHFHQEVNINLICIHT